MQAVGQFEVNLQPLEVSFPGTEGARFNRLSIDKTFTGDLSARSRGEMLSAATGVDNSAGYVALEQVEGELQGRRGTFILQHYGVMQRGAQRLILEVVPDSGTGQLTGLSGQMSIRIEDGRHFYQLDYTLP